MFYHLVFFNSNYLDIAKKVSIIGRKVILITEMVSIIIPGTLMKKHVDKTGGLGNFDRKFTVRLLLITCVLIILLLPVLHYFAGLWYVEGIDD